MFVCSGLCYHSTKKNNLQLFPLHSPNQRYDSLPSFQYFLLALFSDFNFLIWIEAFAFTFAQRFRANFCSHINVLCFLLLSFAPISKCPVPHQHQGPVASHQGPGVVPDSTAPPEPRPLRPRNTPSPLSSTIRSPAVR